MLASWGTESQGRAGDESSEVSRASGRGTLQAGARTLFLSLSDMGRHRGSEQDGV